MMEAFDGMVLAPTLFYEAVLAVEVPIWVMSPVLFNFAIQFQTLDIGQRTFQNGAWDLNSTSYCLMNPGHGGLPIIFTYIGYGKNVDS